MCSPHSSLTKEHKKNVQNVVDIRGAFGGVCCCNLNYGKNWHRRCEQHTGHGHPHGLATGASWLCYYRALQTGRVSQVAPIDKMSGVLTLVLAFLILHEPFTIKAADGTLLITFGTLLLVL